MKTSLDRDMRRRASLHARRQQADIALGKRIQALAAGLLKSDTRRGPGKRSCVVEMRRIEEKREAHMRRIAAGRWANGMEPTVYNTSPGFPTPSLGRWLHRARRAA